ncbi:hypothetical protein BJ165DRAFT_1409716 [Panaeolus papilionaceus]|nr:hypothetical protein BJ165DRAFT_1409716 [Panaeolus papilionaceus]
MAFTQSTETNEAYRNWDDDPEIQKLLEDVDQYLKARAWLEENEQNPFMISDTLENKRAFLSLSESRILERQATLTLPPLLLVSSNGGDTSIHPSKCWFFEPSRLARDPEGTIIQGSVQLFHPNRTFTVVKSQKTLEASRKQTHEEEVADLLRMYKGGIGPQGTVICDSRGNPI